jgi:hypothetical protein
MGKAKLIFTIRNQSIRRTDTFRPVKFSENYLYAEFIFRTGEWLNKTKSVIFVGKGLDPITVLLDDDNMCLIPWEVLECDSFTVSVFAGDLITTNVETVRVFDSGYAEGTKPQPPTSDIYNQIMTSVDETKAIAQSVRNDADIGEFDGVSPTVEIKEDTDTDYVLTITDANGSFDTPNLKGSGGGNVVSGVSSVNGKTGEVILNPPDIGVESITLQEILTMFSNW